MKRSKWISLILAVGMIMSIMACKPKSKPDPSSTTDSSESVISGESNTESLPTGVETADSSQDAESKDGSGSSKTGTSKAPSDSKQIVDKEPYRFGTKTTKKMPNYLSKIKDGTIKYLTSDNGNKELEAAQFSAFKAMTGIDVKIERTVVDWGTMSDRLAAMVMADQAPDMFQIFTGSAVTLSKRPYWEDIEQFIDLDDAFWKDSAELCRNTFAKNGTVYCITNVNSKGVGPSMGYYYNVRLVDEAIAGNPNLYNPVKMFKDNKWTWDTLYEFAEEITTDSDGDGTPEVYGHSMEWSRLNDWITSTGTSLLTSNADGTLKGNISHTNIARALDMYLKLMKLSNNPTPWEGLDMVINNSVGFSYGHAHWMCNNKVAEAAKKAGKIAWVPFPRDPKSNIYYTDDKANALFIPKGAKNPYLTAAWYYFQKYLEANPSSAVEKAKNDQYKNNYGWKDDEIALYTGKVPAANMKKVIGDIRLSGFSWQGGDNYFERKPTTVRSQWIAAVKPTFEQALERFNKSVK